MEGFTYAMSLDLNMEYYDIKMLPKSSTLCTIVLPWDKFEYLKLPMGFKINAQKSFFGHQELEYLAYWVMRQGIKPLKKK
eukprot:12749655-Ditylum_brightwellii.AAC.1